MRQKVWGELNLIKLSDLVAESFWAETRKKILDIFKVGNPPILSASSQMHVVGPE